MFIPIAPWWSSPQVQEIVEILKHDDVGVDEQELVEGPQNVASL